MDYNETIKFLYNQLPVYQNSGNKALNLGLDKIQKLLIELNNPEKFLKIVHIGGTNGKGSSAHSIAAICQYNNLKTGLYTSPHLFDFRERIRVNGKKVEKSFITEFINKKLEKIKKPGINRVYHSKSGWTSIVYTNEKHDLAKLKLTLDKDSIKDMKECKLYTEI